MTPCEAMSWIDVIHRAVMLSFTYVFVFGFLGFCIVQLRKSLKRLAKIEKELEDT